MIEEMMNLVYQEDEEVGQAIKDEYVRQKIQSLRSRKR